MPNRVTTLTILLGLTVVATGAQNRVSRSIDSARTVTLRGQAHPLAQSRWDRGAVDPDMDMPYLTLHFRSGDGQQAALERLLQEQQDASSPNYHRWLTPEEFGDHFGLSESDLAAITDWLRAQGFRVHGAARGRRSIAFGGKARQVAQAFGTEIHRYAVDGQLHYANVASPTVPAAFEDVVEGVLGLDDFEPAPATRKGVFTPSATSVNGVHALAPEDIATIYNYAPLTSAGLDGSGQKIAIGGRTLLDLSDYRAFRKRFNLPANDPALLVVPGSDPGTGAAADVGESNLDIQWASALAPKASITLVYARSTNTAAQYAVDQNIAPVFSLSYGGCEAASPASSVAFLRGVAQQANAQGITWVASTGDVGAAGCERQDILTQATRGMAVQIPAAIPEITAVGGTEFDEGSGTYWLSASSANGGSAMSYIPEKAWNDSSLLFGLASTTGGMSTLFPKPAWQVGPGIPPDNARMVPDLALAASWNHDGWLTYENGVLGTYGGTSVATPVFAGILTLLNQSLTAKGLLKQPGLGNINPNLYRLAQSTTDIFHDIVNGDNIVPCAQGSPACVNGYFGFQAGPGYDLATGLGSIDAGNFVNKWTAGTSSATSVSADPATVAYNGTLTLTTRVTGSGGTASGNVNFISRDGLLGSAALNGGIASLSLSALKLLAGANTVTAVYTGSNQLNGSSGTTVVNVTLPSLGSAVVPVIASDPVYRQNPDNNGNSWFVGITLSERAGVATTLTGLQALGKDYSSQITSLFGRSAIAARGSISATMPFNIPNPPTTGQFVFSGVDAGGRTWSQEIAVQFFANRTQQPWITLTTAAGTGDPKVSTAPGCQFQDQVTVEENGGYYIDLTRFVAGTVDMTPQINQIFGTTHLAPYGVLVGNVCWSAAPASGSNYTISGTTENAVSVTATGAATAITASSGSSPFTVSQPSVSLSAADPSQSATAAVNLAFGGLAAQWSISIHTTGANTNWLNVSPLSGTGAGQVNIKAAGAGLSNGVYSAILEIQAAGTLPQHINIPVMFVVGAAGGTKIGGVSNGASFKTVFAPGMVLSVFGTNLAPGAQAAPSLPLPISMQGVTATVNGITAPLYYVSPGQINLQIPYETGAGPAVVGINNGFKVDGFLFNVAPSAPGIFTGANSALVPFNSGKRGDILLAFTTGEGDISPSLFTGRTPGSSTPIARLPKPLLPVTLTVGGVDADIVFVGIPPGLSGVAQINFTVPANAPLGDQPVVVTVGGVASSAARLTVTQ